MKLQKLENPETLTGKITKMEKDNHFHGESGNEKHSFFDYYYLLSVSSLELLFFSSLYEEKFCISSCGPRGISSPVIHF